MRKFLTALWLCLLAAVAPCGLAAPAPLPRAARAADCAWPVGVWRMADDKSRHTTLTLYRGGRAVERWGRESYEAVWRLEDLKGQGENPVLTVRWADSPRSYLYVLRPDGPGRLRVTWPYCDTLVSRVK